MREFSVLAIAPLYLHLAAHAAAASATTRHGVQATRCLFAALSSRLCATFSSSVTAGFGQRWAPPLKRRRAKPSALFKAEHKQSGAIGGRILYHYFEAVGWGWTAAYLGWYVASYALVGGTDVALAQWSGAAAAGVERSSDLVLFLGLAFLDGKQLTIDLDERRMEARHGANQAPEMPLSFSFCTL